MESVVEGAAGGEERQFEYFAEFFFQLPGSQEASVRGVEIADHALLGGGEVLPVAHQQPPQPFQRLRGVDGLCLAEPVPFVAADLVERVGGPADDVERIDTYDRFRCTGGDDGAYSFGTVSGDET